MSSEKLEKSLARVVGFRVRVGSKDSSDTDLVICTQSQSIGLSMFFFRFIEVDF